MEFICHCVYINKKFQKPQYSAIINSFSLNRSSIFEFNLEISLNYD